VEPLRVLDLAVESFGSRLRSVAIDQWVAPTPCDDWDVHYLVAHVVGGNRFAAAILAGSSADEAIEQVMGTPQLGEAPVEDFETSALPQRIGFGGDRALDRECHHPLGDMSGGEFLRLRVLDLTVHSWDPARAIGANEQLDDGLVGCVLDIVESAATTGGLGFGITALGLAIGDAAPQDRLLDLCGRRS